MRVSCPRIARILDRTVGKRGRSTIRNALRSVFTVLEHSTAPCRSPIAASLLPIRARSVCAAHALTGGPVDGGPSEAVSLSVFPRTCSRIRSISAGSSMQAMIFTAWPQRTQLSTSMPKTRFSRWAQLIAACRSMAERSGCAVPFPFLRPLPEGVTSARQRWFGASTPW